MRKVFAGIAAASLALTLGACGATGGDDKAAGGSEVDVVTWWSAGSEKEGLAALQKVFEEQNPDIKFVNAAVSGGAGSQAKQKLAADLAAKNPPDTYQSDRKSVV